MALGGVLALAGVVWAGECVLGRRKKYKRACAKMLSQDSIVPVDQTEGIQGGSSRVSQGRENNLGPGEGTGPRAA